MRKLSIKKFVLLFGIIGVLLVFPVINTLVTKYHYSDLILGLIGCVLIVTGIELLRIDLFTPGWKDKDLEFTSGHVSTPWNVGFALATMSIISLYAGVMSIVKTISSLIADKFDFAAFAYYGLSMIFLIAIKIAKEKPPTN